MSLHREYFVELAAALVIYLEEGAPRRS